MPVDQQSLFPVGEIIAINTRARVADSEFSRFVRVVKIIKKKKQLASDVFDHVVKIYRLLPPPPLPPPRCRWLLLAINGTAI